MAFGGGRFVHGALAALRAIFSSAEIRPQYRVTKQFLRADAARIIVAHEPISFAATGALKCRILW
jgi:hypothetical protein